MSNNEVESFLADFEHPLKAELLVLRDYIKTNFPTLTEIIKWNAPSYKHDDIDFLTFNLAKPNDIKLILHRGAKNKEQPKTKIIEDKNGILKWASNDRAVITITPQSHIDKENLRVIITNWMGKL